MTQDLQRLQREGEYAREREKENEMLKTEITVMHQHLRRLDPNVPHVYGHFSAQLNQGPPGQQPNGAPPMSLPPIAQTAPGQAPPTGYGNGPPAPAAAMQGVEYGGGYNGR